MTSSSPRDDSPAPRVPEEPVDALRAAGPVGRALVQATRLHKSLAAQLFRPLGLHLSQELVLLRLWDEGPQRQTDLVRALASDAATMTRTIGRLEDAGLVQRTPSPDDGRAAIVAATAQSFALRGSVEEAWEQIERAVIADLTESEQLQAIEFLHRISRGLRRAQTPADD